MQYARNNAYRCDALRKERIAALDPNAEPATELEQYPLAVVTCWHRPQTRVYLSNWQEQADAVARSLGRRANRCATKG